MQTIELKAPLDGVILPLEQVPDPVFAQKMVGDGVSIDPLSQVLVAPCAGVVTNLHRAGHAVTLTTPSGIELMMHIGLDTVNLKGEGFTPKVVTGQTVAAGDALIAFDADFLATHAKSLLTQIVVTNGERVAAYHPASGLVRAGIDTVLSLDLAEGGAAEAQTSGKRVISEAVLIPNPTGLHARPAAVLANLAKRFQSRVLIQRGDDQANAKSLVSIMGLAIEQGDKVVLIAEGPDAEEVIARLVPELASGLGDEGSTPAPAPATTEISADSAPAPRPRSDDPNLLLGVAASPGLAVGKVWRLRREEIAVQEVGEAPNQERRRLEDALDLARNQLEALQAELRGQADPAKAAIFAAHQELLGDPGLLDIAESAIAKGKSAAFAWRAAFTTHAEGLARLRNELLAGRANDLRDVGRRVLAIITGTPLEEPQAPPDTILIAEDLTPSDTARLDRGRVLGFATVGGGSTSHVAIIARSLDIPAVAGIEPRAMDLPDGTPVILDGSKGSLRLNPDPLEIARIKTLKERQATRRANDLATALDPAVTSDGHRIEVVANIGGLEDAARSVTLGGEGVGLLRSEFLYMDRTSAPTEEDQFAIYSAIAKALDGRPLIIRTLDVGGDKPLAYLPMPREENPMLGIRGVRIGLDRPEILRTQVRAILRAGQGNRLRMMFPMIATLDEIRSVKGLVEEERARLGVADVVELGIMVEVPAAAVLARQFAREVDFFSIGTNDLTQYTLAMDRGHPKLAAKADAMNPAILQLIAQTVEGAAAEGKWVGVCGGLASDPQAVPILVGLGVAELSVSVPSIPAVKAQVRARSLPQCQDLAEQALAQDSAAAVRALVPLDY
ncbi:phosphoenolpyruvate--protein phosphotransferase [Candidatus Thiodictyon syntrophicum]|uniref:phosphoenolpyruvate--protein phosphotransferase n=1 Tax=Candidatus Thiodictyon syntrophicum TaxID=1166950 RepID=A0A2K8UBK4_9GAMM|nr:phosphoenolpyruvate--protein phosphotransferase [Candidatus Thiodictyon syntrophicum]AUB82431.1 phosphoenolpyruvate--protein phosphotransferase [Candidatus Thiodictyon syntrophicum]